MTRFRITDPAAVMHQTVAASLFRSVFTLVASFDKFLAGSDKSLLDCSATFASFHLFASSPYSQSVCFGGCNGCFGFPGRNTCCTWSINTCACVADLALGAKLKCGTGE